MGRAIQALDNIYTNDFVTEPLFDTWYGPLDI